MKKILLLACAAAVTHLATAQAIRLKANATYTYQTGGYLIQDTSWLNYSFGRAAHDPNAGQHFLLWAADAVTTQLYDPGTSQFYNQNLVTQEFASWQTTRSYSSDWNGSSWDTVFRYTYSYDPNRIDTFYFDVKTGGNWEKAGRTTFTYGTDGLLTRRQSVWNTQQNDYEDTARFTIAYLGGKPAELMREVFVGGGWDAHSREIYTYTGDSITTVITQNYAGGWQNASKAEFEYHTQTNDLIQKDYYDWDTNAWKPAKKVARVFDVDHNCILEWYYRHDGTQWLDTYRMEYEYYSPGLLSVSTLNKYSYVTFQYEPHIDDPKNFYYYEEIDPASVWHAALQGSLLSVYPSPSPGIINISFPQAQPEPFSITIFDAAGRAVRHWKEGPGPLYQKQVNLSDLQSGNYFLRIDNHQQEIRQFTILR